MRTMRYVLLFAATLLAAPVYSQSKPAADKPADNMQILREKLKADKKLVVAANMDLTEAEAKGFWPLYEEYQKELHKINHQLPAIREAASCPIVVDCHDNDVQLAAEMVPTVPVFRRAGPLANAIGARSALTHCLPLADEVWAVSAADASGLARLAGGRPVLTVPSGVDEGQAAATSSAGRNWICAVVANYAYGPNLAGVQW